MNITAFHLKQCVNGEYQIDFTVDGYDHSIRIGRYNLYDYVGIEAVVTDLIELERAIDYAEAQV